MISASVPCNGCTACCQNDLIMLHPEHGDRPENYPGGIREATNPVTGEHGYALIHKPGGGCHYVTDQGCSIHGRAPAVCREFDCRKLLKNWLAIPRAERRRLAKRLNKHDLFAPAVRQAAEARLHTLPDC